MAGLSMKIGAYGGGSNTGAQASQPAPTTASQAAWGPSYGSNVGGGLLAALTPNDAFGIAHWAGLAAVGFLGWLYWTLPN